MSKRKPFIFNGTKYANVEAMLPEVRAVYKLQQDQEQAELEQQEHPERDVMHRSHARSSLLALGLGALSLALLALWLGSTLAAGAAGPIVVNSLADTSSPCAVSGTGTCTLRDALTFANSNPGADTITFSVGGTITLMAPLPAISGTVTIDGGGAITVSGASAYTVLTISSSADVSLQALTIASGYSNGGDGGAGIDNGGTLTVINSTLISNTSTLGGGAIENGGTLTVTNSTLVSNTADSGGGIDNSGTEDVTVINSTLASNTAGDGGGIRNSGTGVVTISNSTLVSNTADSDGGGIDNSGTGRVTVTNSTLVGNGAPFGGGGIENSGTETVTLQNTLVARSPSGGDCAGTPTADQYNLADDHTCAGATYTTTAALQLGPLQNNGGSTWTMALGPGSAAIDAGNNAACPATDQRGFPRLSSCDIGAYEVVYRIYLPLALKQP